ncbi:hypothetical protein Afil01_02890 [Actinorhabdospora filicis]|uniref:Malonyl-CoA:ACP transacylase (MAT) domain-containing protein n=1 Tax=Actinorhabdospora filicis TaxID=1785913 RepID=A0A9W6SGK5_9ACTN|nr:AMP-binding protein [Actinorhabdospora filicis]GLZ75482.1 hypothetical protein Afil01_02890 [Actinorhabdospora filicis]
MSQSPTPPEGPVAFVYAGPESSVGDAAELALDPAFAAVLDECAGAYREVTGANLRGRLAYPDPDWPADIAQPVLVSLQLAMTAALAAHGVTPGHVFGHGTGELTALVAAGALDAREAVRLVSLRARLMQEYGAPAGAVEVRATAAEAEALCARVPGIETAAVDGPDRRVLAGPEDAVAALIALCEGTGVRTRRQQVTRAFHTSLADPVLRELEEELAGMRFRPTRLPVTSGVDGRTRPPGWLPDAAHLRDQARLPVRFDLALGALLGSGCRTLVQVGPEGVRANAGGEASSGAALLTGEVETGRVGARWHAAGNLYYAGVSIAPPPEPPPTPRTPTVTTTAPPPTRIIAPDPVVGRHRARAAEQERILRVLAAAGALDVSLSLPDAGYPRVLEIARFAEAHGLRALWLPGPVPAAAIAGQTRRLLLRLDAATAAERAVVDDASEGRAGYALHTPFTHPDERWRGRADAIAANAGEAAEAARLGLDAIVDAAGPAAAYRAVRHDGRVAVRVPLDAAADPARLAEAREAGADEVIVVLGAEAPEWGEFGEAHRGEIHGGAPGAVEGEAAGAAMASAAEREVGPEVEADSVSAPVGEHSHFDGGEHGAEHAAEHEEVAIEGGFWAATGGPLEAAGTRYPRTPGGDASAPGTDPLSRAGRGPADTAHGPTATDIGARATGGESETEPEADSASVTARTGAGASEHGPTAASASGVDTHADELAHGEMGASLGQDGIDGIDGIDGKTEPDSDSVRTPAAPVTPAQASTPAPPLSTSAQARADADRLGDGDPAEGREAEPDSVSGQATPAPGVTPSRAAPRADRATEPDSVSGRATPTPGTAPGQAAPRANQATEPDSDSASVSGLASASPTSDPTAAPNAPNTPAAPTTSAATAEPAKAARSTAAEPTPASEGETEPDSESDSASGSANLTSAPTSDPTPSQAPDPVHAPLSPAQTLLWPHRSDGNLVRAVQFDGPLTVSALTAALRAVVARHEPLRTMYSDITGRPLQIVLPQVDLDVPVTDLTGYHEDTAVRHALATASSASLDQAAGKAVSFQLLRFSYTRHVLICAFHPLTVDPWSYQVLAAELAELYRAALDGEAAPLPAAVPYSSLPAPEVSAGTGAYWAERFAVAPEPLDLPSDRVRPEAPGPGAGSVNLEVPSALAERVRALAADAGVTVPTVVLTAFAAALHGLSGREDVVVGAEVPGAGALVGPLSRLLPIRLDMSGDPAFTLLLASARDATAAARGHAAGVPHVPALAATVEFDGGILEPALTGVRTTVLDFPPDPLRTDLRLRVWQRDGLRWRLDYRDDVFGEEVAQNVLGAVLDVLVAAVATPSAPLTEILGLGEPLTPAVTGPAMPPSTDSVHELFELQAAATPDAVAVVCGETTWTYRELRERAGTLARLLHRHGTGAGDLVAVLIPRRPDLIAAQLAVLRLGAVFLPLDPARPLDELTGTARGARMVLASRNAPDLGVAVVHVEDDPGETGEPPAPPADPERAAYHVRTQVPGRTVAVSHRALVNMVRWGMTTLGLASGDAVAHMLDLDLDVNLAEIYPALLAGAAVHMVPEELRDDELELTAWWTLKRITVACLPAPLADRVFARPLPDGNRLRFLLVGGRKVRRRPPISFPTVFSLYGVPENAIVAALAILAQEGEDAPDIGLPVDNNRLYIVDRHGGPARPGTPGELWIGGAGVASGYPGDPEATAAAFRPGPDGTTLFRTGDQVRLRGDGALEYCGPVPAWAVGHRRPS